MARKQISENPSEAYSESADSSQNPSRPGTSQSSVKKFPVITASAFSKLTSTQDKKRQLSAQKKNPGKSGKKKKREDGRPAHPGLFHVLLPKGDMIRLIEQGMKEMEEDIKLIHVSTDKFEEAEEILAPSLGVKHNDTSTTESEELEDDSSDDTDSDQSSELL